MEMIYKSHKLYFSVLKHVKPTGKIHNQISTETKNTII